MTVGHLPVGLTVFLSFLNLSRCVCVWGGGAIELSANSLKPILTITAIHLLPAVPGCNALCGVQVMQRVLAAGQGVWLQKRATLTRVRQRINSRARAGIADIVARITAEPAATIDHSKLLFYQD